MEKNEVENAVIVVTADHAEHAVYFGYLTEREGNAVTLRDGRFCFYWGVGTGGYVGLAVNGPQGESRFGPTASKITVFNVAAIFECTKEGEKKCLAQGW